MIDKEKNYFKNDIDFKINDETVNEIEKLERNKEDAKQENKKGK